MKFLIASASLKIQMSKRVLGTGKAELAARVIRFGPNSTRGRLKFGRMLVCLRAGVPDPNCSEPSREGRASVCNRPVERRIRAISADWRF